MCTIFSWAANLNGVLAANGIPNTNLIGNQQEFIFYFKKGVPATAQTAIAPNDSTPEVLLNVLIGGNWYKGYITSEIVGPAIQWNECHWASHHLDTHLNHQSARHPWGSRWRVGDPHRRRPVERHAVRC